MSNQEHTTHAKMGTLAYTMATWVYALHTRGIPTALQEVEAACLALDQGQDLEEKGEALVLALRAALPNEDTSAAETLPAETLAAETLAAETLAAETLAAHLFGTATIATGLGESREQALHQARRYQFRRNLPWMACIVDRFPDGHVGEHWVLVEALDATVRCLDPYPWDDIDEEHEQPLVEFMVKWELGGLQGLRYVG